MKAVQVADERAEGLDEYKRWRIALGVGAVWDVDQVEWRWVDGDLRPVAVIELTTVAPGFVFADADHTHRYLAKVVERYDKGQGQNALTVADGLNVNAWVVLWMPEMRTFFRYCLSFPTQWERLAIYEYKRWLITLKPRSREA